MSVGFSTKTQHRWSAGELWARLCLGLGKGLPLPPRLALAHLRHQAGWCWEGLGILCSKAPSDIKSCQPFSIQTELLAWAFCCWSSQKHLEMGPGRPCVYFWAKVPVCHRRPALAVGWPAPDCFPGQPVPRPPLAAVHDAAR